MSDFDPCECVDIYNHESAMRRLMNMLRDSQSACTDSGCDDLPTDPNVPGNEGMMMMMLGWVFVATLLYFLRPRALRRSGDEKPSSSGNGSNPPPPGPSVH